MKLRQITQRTSNIISLLVTSHKHGAIAREFEETKQLDIRATDEDVETYIED
jgi:hypothetical protein